MIEFWILGLLAHDTYLHIENTPLFIIIAISLAVVSYFVGSINCSILLSKIYGKDVREGGSGNAGATNMVRQFGKKAGVLTFLGDFFKAFLLSAVGLLLAGMLGSLIAGLFCIIGHAFPVYFKFRGGKGFSSMVAVMIVTNPIVFSVVGTIYLILLFGTKMVSFAAIMTMIIYPFVFNAIYQPGPEILVASLCAFLIIFLHRKNIVRIFNHTEPKIDLSKLKKKKKAIESATVEQENEEPNEADEQEKENNDENSEE